MTLTLSVTEERTATTYYADKLDALSDLFGADVRLGADALLVGGRSYPIVDDVIILLEHGRLPPAIARRVHVEGTAAAPAEFAEDIQFTFGEEWQAFPDIMSEHEAEFRQYFDLIDLDSLRDARVCDLGCGIGRWSHHLADHCRELVLIDFSEAIFVARRNLRGDDRALFFMADLTRLPFRDGAIDVGISLGVLHHLPTDALAEARRLARLAPTWLFYLYYALDNRPAYFRALLRGVTAVRSRISRIRNRAFRGAFTACVTAGVYMPLVLLGHALSPLGLGHRVPLYEGYRGKSFRRIRQDAYDRFFTPIEQRVRREDILRLTDTYATVRVSDGLPYWHFLVSGRPDA